MVGRLVLCLMYGFGRYQLMILTGEETNLFLLVWNEYCHDVPGAGRID